MTGDYHRIRKILSDSRTIAVVGCSSNPGKPSHEIPKYMKEQGYQIMPVNPTEDEILVEKSYSNLSEITEPVDIVNIFRPSEEVLEIVEEAVKLKPKCIWMQMGIRNNEARELAESNGIHVIMDRCIMEYNSLMK